MEYATARPQDGPERLALITGELPDGVCLRIEARLTVRRDRPFAEILQTRHVPVSAEPGRYRQDGACRMQYSGRRIHLVPEHLRQLQDELAEENAVIDTHGLDHQRLSAYLHEITAPQSTAR
jgi:hypothetical protein